MPERLSAYEGSEPFVFVSYAHKDSGIVLPLIRGLQARGFRVWYDAGLEVGTEWPDYIAGHLEKCCCVLAFVSRNFGESHNCRREVNFAIEERKDPVVIYLEPRENLNAGMRMQLGSLHAMFYDRYADAEGFLDALSRAEILRPCMRVTTEGPQPVPYPTIDFADDAATVPAESPEEWFVRAEKLYGEKKYEEAIVWYRKAAEQGHARAQNIMGYSYKTGEGVSKDNAEAVKWYSMAAKQGYDKAQCNLGRCYEKGEGVRQDYIEAVKWFHMAAEQGYMQAQRKLGICYELGRGVSKNLKQALAWYRKAKESGHPNVDEDIVRCEAALKRKRWWN